jgi:hypothetical protein
MTLPQREADLSFVIPAANENRWSDLLASLISTDPVPISPFVGAEPDSVRREVVVPGVTARKSDRLDLLLLRGGKQLAAIEAKLLADLGPQQLSRYEVAFPNAGSHLVLHLNDLPLNLRAAPRWRSLTWESVLSAYSTSAHPWVSATAKAWLSQLTTLVPRVNSETVWNEVPDDAAGFELALRARVAWLASQMDTWCTLDHDLELSSGGGAWVAAMRSAPLRAGHRVVAEIQEGLAAQDWRQDPAHPYRDKMTGPVVLVGLSQAGVATSAGFDWSLLRRLFVGRVVDQSGAVIDGRPWQTTSANPRDLTDRANWQATVTAGAPKWLGKGYGMATTRTHAVCAFGARIQIAPQRTLGEINAELQQLQSLVSDMSAAAAGGRTDLTDADISGS